MDSGSTDSACAPPVAIVSACGTASCDFGTNYCLFGAVPNQCLPLPSECTCAATHTCACALANLPTCDAGFKSCTPYQDGGVLWVAVSAGCH